MRQPRSSREALRLYMEYGAAWRRFCFCCDSPDPPQPDPNIGVAAKANAEISKEALDFNKQMYADYKPYLERMADTSQQAADLQMGIARDQSAQASDYQDYMKGTFRPVEKSVVDEAMKYDAGKEGEIMAERAGATVDQQLARQKESQSRTLTGYGVNPNSSRFVAQDKALGIQGAAMKSAAMNDARENAKTIGWAKRMDAAGLGRNLPSNQATSASLATSSAGAGVGSSAEPGKGVIAGANMMNQGYGTAIQGNNSAGNLYLGQFDAQMQGYKAQQDAQSALWSGLGTLAGAAVTRSSKKLKTNKQKLDKAAALESVQKTPVESWDYKPGVEDGGRHIGPYAEDFKRNFGVGDGKRINLMDEIGVTMAAVQGLAERVDEISDKLGMEPGDSKREERSERGHGVRRTA